MTSPIRLDLAADTDAASQARRAIESLRGELSAPVMDDARLLVSELVTNSVRHGRLGPEQTVALRARISGHVLRVEVTDDGRGFAFAPRTAASADDSGWGLYLVERIADRWGISADPATTVWFELDLGAGRMARHVTGDRSRPRTPSRSGQGSAGFAPAEAGYGALDPTAGSWEDPHGAAPGGGAGRDARERRRKGRPPRSAGRLRAGLPGAWVRDPALGVQPCDPMLAARAAAEVHPRPGRTSDAGAAGAGRPRHARRSARLSPGRSDRPLPLVPRHTPVRVVDASGGYHRAGGGHDEERTNDDRDQVAALRRGAPEPSAAADREGASIR